MSGTSGAAVQITVKMVGLPGPPSPGQAIYAQPSPPNAAVGRPNDLWFDITNPASVVLYIRAALAWIGGGLAGGGGTPVIGGGGSAGLVFSSPANSALLALI